jgi:hypothetical protein
VFRENSICWIENSIEELIGNIRILKKKRNKKSLLWKDFAIQYSYARFNGNGYEKFEMRIFPFVFSIKYADIFICFPPFEKSGISTLKTGAFSIMYLRTVMLSYAYLWMQSNFNHHHYYLRNYIIQNQEMYPLDFLRYRQPYVKMKREVVENWMKFTQIFINNLSKVNFIHYFFWIQMKRDFKIDYNVFENKMNMTTNLIRENEKFMEMSKIENLNIENISVQFKERKIFDNVFDNPKYYVQTNNDECIKSKNVKEFITDTNHIIFNKYIEKKTSKKGKLEKLKIDEVFQAFFFNREKNKNFKFYSQKRSDVKSTQNNFANINEDKNFNDKSNFKDETFNFKSNFENNNSQSKIFEPKIPYDDKFNFNNNKEILNQDSNLNESSFESQNCFPIPDEKLQEPFSSLYVRKPNFFNPSNHNSKYDKKQKTFDFEKFALQFVESPQESNKITKVKSSSSPLDTFPQNKFKQNEKRNSLNFDPKKHPNEGTFVEEKMNVGQDNETISFLNTKLKNLKKKKLLDTHFQITDEIVDLFLSNRKKHAEKIDNKEKSPSQNYTEQNLQETSTSVETKKPYLNTQNIFSLNEQGQNFYYSKNNKKSFDFEKFALHFAESSTQSDNSEEKLTPKFSFITTGAAETLSVGSPNNQEQTFYNSKHDKDKKSFNFENFASQISESTNSIDGTSTPFYRKPSYEKSSFKKSSSKNFAQNLKNDLYFYNIQKK